MSRPIPPARPDSSHADLRWRQRLLVVAAVLLVGGALLARIWGAASAGSAFAEANRIAERIGVDVTVRPVPWDRADLPLEAAPGTPGPATSRRLAAAAQSADILIVNFWATWCPPCIDELPSFVALADSLRGRDVAVVAVSYDDDWPSQADAIQRSLGRPWPDAITWLRDPAGQSGEEGKTVRAQFGTRKLPETWVVRGGEIIAGFIGPQQWDRPEIQRYFSLVTRERR